MLRLERRPSPSRFWEAASPFLAVVLTMLAGGLMFWALGKNPVEAIRTIFWDPLFNAQFAAYSRPQLLVKAAPLILIAIGLSLGFRAGVWNIGAEGQYIMGAIFGAAAGFLGGALGAMALSSVLGVLTQVLQTNQVATGLALTLFGLGLSSLIGQGYVGVRPPATEQLALGPLAELPFLGVALLRHDWMVYGAVLLVAALWWVLRHTRLGLILRAVGESHDAAHALAIVVFASWKPWRMLLGAHLFGGITVLQRNLQVAGSAIPVEYLSMAPYLLTILVLGVMSSGRGRAALAAPACLGQNFHASR